MQIHFGVETLEPEWHASVVCLGTFDGVHLGHQAVISEAVRQAESKGLPSVLITFDRHPASVLKPEACPPTLSSLGANLHRFEKLNVSCAVVLAFTEAFSNTAAQDFLDETLIEKLRATAAVVGHDFAFGHNREGTAQWLAEKIQTTIVQPVLMDGLRVSSSAVRAELAKGEVESARRMLGRPFEIEGIVAAGEQLGRTIGYPTLNLALAKRFLIPLDGVYAGTCKTGLGEFKAAISIGDRPTVEGEKRTIEAYLLDYPGTSLYGKSVVLRFERRLRAQEKFESLETLRAQIERDVVEVGKQELTHG